MGEPSDPDQGVKRNLSQGESSSSDATDGGMKKQKLEGGDAEKETVQTAKSLATSSSSSGKCSTVQSLISMS